MPECPSCGHENPSGTARCGRCDTPLPAPSTQQIEEQLCSLLREGRKIEAIKVYREANGVGLKEAKDAVETLAARRGIADPGGCAGRAALLVTLLAAATLGVFRATLLCW